MIVLKVLLVLLGFFTIFGALLVVICGSLWIINIELYELFGRDFAKEFLEKHERSH